MTFISTEVKRIIEIIESKLQLDIHDATLSRFRFVKKQQNYRKKRNVMKKSALILSDSNESHMFDY